MWSFVVLTVVLAAGITKIIAQNEINNVTQNWAEKRCDPSIMFWAAMFKPPDDPRSDTQFVTDNFSYCTGQIANNVMADAVQPVIGFSGLMADSTAHAISYNNNLRTTSSNMWNGLSSIFNIFGSKFILVFSQFRVTFFKLQDAFKQACGIAIASFGAGISALFAIWNIWLFILIIVIIILVIIIAILAYLAYLFLPMMALLILAIALMAEAVMVYDDSVNWCFHPDTPLRLRNGKIVKISQVAMGDVLADTSEVISIMKFKTSSGAKFYKYDTIIVSGTHIVYENGKPVFVKDSSCARPYDGDRPEEIYCLNTSYHKIPIAGATKTHLFADWEELDTSAMVDWSSFIYESLNSIKRDGTVADEVLESETGFAFEQKISVWTGKRYIQKSIGELSLGDFIPGRNNTVTEVTGLVHISKSENKTFGTVDSIPMSGATWIFDTDNLWKHAAESKRWVPALPVSDMYSIFTKCGMFKVGEILVRDFSDVGCDNIEKTYDFTLSRLLSNK